MMNCFSGFKIVLTGQTERHGGLSSTYESHSLVGYSNEVQTTFNNEVPTLHRNYPRGTKASGQNPVTLQTSPFGSSAGGHQHAVGKKTNYLWQEYPNNLENLCTWRVVCPLLRCNVFVAYALKSACVPDWNADPAQP